MEILSDRGEYKIIFRPDYKSPNSRNGFIPEHIYIAETEILHRPIKSDGKLGGTGELVHHINMIKHDNRPENLMVFHTKSDHSRYHAMMNKGLVPIVKQLDDGTWICEAEDRDIPCAYCGRMFTPKTAKAKYCCSQCLQLSQRVVERPSKKELKQLMLEFNIEEIAEIYGVTGNGVRRWCQYYNLKYKLKDRKLMIQKEREKAEAKSLKAEYNKRQKERDKHKKITE